MKVRNAKKIFAESLAQYDFDQLHKTSRNRREQKRYLAFAHIKEGRNFTEAAKMVRVSLRGLMTWVKKFRKGGIKTLKDSYGGGRRPHVPLYKHEIFKQSVLDLQTTRSGGRIRGKDVADLIRKQFGVIPSQSSVYKTLKRVGLVWITGRSIHPKADKNAQASFKKTS